ncbi:hypothetical protein [Microcoleus sp. LEGE 07076]|uniref:hypothetical protein n=1 Tax=Microcoleus sp. LEGE 07076 TaxID=915322 RepID=UPI00403EF7F4
MSCWLLVVGYWLLVICCLLFVVCYLLLVIIHQSSGRMLRVYRFLLVCILRLIKWNYSGYQTSEDSPMRYALCPMPYALCPMPHSTSSF